MRTSRTLKYSVKNFYRFSKAFCEEHLNNNNGQNLITVNYNFAYGYMNATNCYSKDIKKGKHVT